jgi:hypothetical protein
MLSAPAERGVPGFLVALLVSRAVFILVIIGVPLLIVVGSCRRSTVMGRRRDWEGVRPAFAARAVPAGLTRDGRRDASAHDRRTAPLNAIAPTGGTVGSRGSVTLPRVTRDEHRIVVSGRVLRLSQEPALMVLIAGMLPESQGCRSD